MRIQMGGLSDGLHEYRFRVPAADLGLGEEFSEVTAEVTLDKTAGQILLRAAIRTEGTFACDRCTRQFHQVLTPSYQMYYVWEGSDTSRLDPAEVQVLAPGTSVIDLTEDVRQTVEVAVPLKLLCREDCKGLCPQCGKDWNEGPCDCTPQGPDPRWEKLAALRKKATHDP